MQPTRSKDPETAEPAVMSLIFLPPSQHGRLIAQRDSLLMVRPSSFSMTQDLVREGLVMVFLW